MATGRRGGTSGQGVTAHLYSIRGARWEAGAERALPPGVDRATLDEIGRGSGKCLNCPSAGARPASKGVLNGSFVADIIEPNDMECVLRVAPRPGKVNAMVTITFADREAEKRALAFLLGRFSGRVLKSGEHLVPEAALEALADQNISFIVKGRTTYEQQMAAVRGAPSAPVQRRARRTGRLARRSRS
jgi:hypothetical protein